MIHVLNCTVLYDRSSSTSSRLEVVYVAPIADAVGQACLSDRGQAGKGSERGMHCWLNHPFDSINGVVAAHLIMICLPYICCVLSHSWIEVQRALIQFNSSHERDLTQAYRSNFFFFPARWSSECRGHLWPSTHPPVTSAVGSAAPEGDMSVKMTTTVSHGTHITSFSHWTANESC